MNHLRDAPSLSAISRVAKYVSLRAVILLVMIAIGIFLTIVVVNYGGYIDDIHRAEIDEASNFISLSMRGASEEEVAQATAQYKAAMEEAYGLNKPFLLRCLGWFYKTVTFDWGKTYRIGFGRFLSSEATDVRLIVLGRVPYTLLLAGSTNVIVFFASISVALHLSKKYGSLLDKLFITLSPLSSIPNWVYGIILTVIFAGELHILPFKGLFDTFPPATKWGYIPIVLKHMILPVTAIFLGMFFSAVYTWRTFFLIHSGEDYLDLAKAKGLPASAIDRRYVLKPTLPYLITSFAILMITFWQGIIVLEVFFDWPGLGQLFMQSIAIKEISVTIGIVVVFAILLGLSVFLLDIIYVLVDPRVKITSEGQSVMPVRRDKKGSQWLSSIISSVFSVFDYLENLITGWRKQNQAGLRLQFTPAYRHQAVPSSKPIRPAFKAGRDYTAHSGYCPQLRLANHRGDVHDVPGHLCRCFVNDRPERIGSSFQAEVCRTSAYRTCPRFLPASPGTQVPLPKLMHIKPAVVPHKRAIGIYASLREFARYPAAVLGVLIIVAMIGVSIYAMIAIPYDEAIVRWSQVSPGKDDIPKYAQPVWVNWFRKDPLPPTIIQNSADASANHGSVSKLFTPGKNGMTVEVITYAIPFSYGGFPQDMLLTFDGQYEKKPFVSLTWLTPDGREFDLGSFSVVSRQMFVANEQIPRKYLDNQVFLTHAIVGTSAGSVPPVEVLFMHPGEDVPSLPQAGTYTLRINATLFDEGASLDAKMVLYGQVYGLGGTDDYRRDLMVPLLWGTPIALAFGLLGAVSTGVISMMIAAVGAWYGGWVDSLVQRLTEVNMILPALPLAITIYYLYSKSIWMILGVLILLGIFGSSIKNYRAAFLQVKELPYIEAARSYGAGSWRIIRKYLLPRIIPLLIPQLVILVPSYVFFEATLAYLNVSDPKLPTWGKVVFDALNRGAFSGHYYWVLEPVALMILTGLAFAFVGFALDSILNPRLRRL